MTIGEQKKALRKVMFEQRKQLNVHFKREYDNWICEELEKSILEHNCTVVHSYIPFSGEIDIAPLLKKLKDLQIQVICPKTLPQRKLENRIFTSFEELETGIMGTQHPANPVIHDGTFNFIIVPGLAFDQSNYRLGYGGGYYDNFLKMNPTAIKTGIFYPFQRVDAVPVEPHDFRLDSILVKEF